MNRISSVKNYRRRGSAILLVALFILLGSIIGVSLMSRSAGTLSLSGIFSDKVNAQYLMEAGYAQAKAKIDRAIEAIRLPSGKLALLTGSATIENYNSIVSTYLAGATSADQKANALLFLQHLIEAQAYNGNGVRETSSEFYNFQIGSSPAPAFPTTWTDVNPNDNEYWEVKYAFDALIPIQETNPNRITFEYEYRYEVRAYGQEKFTQSGAENAGLISVVIDGAPFSLWAILRDRTQNQNGSNLHFVGNSTPEIFFGKVHTNQQPYFWGAPVFQDLFSSAAAYASWYFGTSTSTGYVGSPLFNEGYQASVPNVSMPSVIFNTARMASGDSAATAAFNNTAPTNAELRSFLATTANGTLTAGTSAVPAGIYIPINNSASKTPTGGIYVEGDASSVVMDVAYGSTSFHASEWANISVGDRSCKFQKIAVSHTSGAVPGRNIYVGDDPCETTYVFNQASLATAPVVLNGRVNGNVHVNGGIDSLGGGSRSRAAIVKDFAYTVSAVKEIQITNDLQYEDVEYVSLDAQLLPTETVVATPVGEFSGSGTNNLSASIAATIPADSRTMLGIISTQRRVVLDTNVPANVNLHAAVYAGNSNAYNSGTGLGCGNSGASTQGCGFGYEAWQSALNMEALKLFGSISEYKNQTVGVAASPPRGFTKRYGFDTRLASSVTPPGFPISSTARATGTVQPLKTWRLSRAD